MKPVICSVETTWYNALLVSGSSHCFVKVASKLCCLRRPPKMFFYRINCKIKEFFGRNEHYFIQQVCFKLKMSVSTFIILQKIFSNKCLFCVASQSCAAVLGWADVRSSLADSSPGQAGLWKVGGLKGGNKALLVWKRRGRGRAGELTVPAVGGGWPAGSGLWQEHRLYARETHWCKRHASCSLSPTLVNITIDFSNFEINFVSIHLYES